MLTAVFGIAILAAVVYIVFRLMKNAILVVAVIAAVLFASFMIFGSLPDFSDIPIVGQYLQTLPSTTEDAIAVIKDVFYSFDILDASKDSSGKVLITIANTGQMELSGFNVTVDGNGVDILNDPKDPLASGKVTTIQTNWTGNFETIKITCDQTDSEYP